MRRPAIVTFAVVMSILLMTVPATGSHSPTISINTTDSDFGNASTLANVSIDGTGTSAAVNFSDRVSNPLEDDGDGTSDTTLRIAGDDADDTAIQAEMRLEPEQGGTLTEITVNVSEVSGSDYGALVDIRLVEEAPDGTYGEGTVIFSDWDPSWSTGTQTIDVTDSGLSEDTTYTLEFISDSTDNDANDDSIRIGGDDSVSGTWSSEGGSTFSVAGDLDAAISMTAGQYVGQQHDVTDPSTGFVDLATVDATTVTVEWQFHDGSSWQVDTTSTFTTAGNKSMSLSSSADAWRVNVSFDADSGSTTTVLEDEGVQAKTASPSFDNSSADPSGGETIEQESVDLSINLTDADFPTAEGDSVTVEFFVNGTKTGETTLTSNGTATVTHQIQTAGTRQWHAEATDDYGHTQTSDTSTFTTPTELQVLNETAVNESQSDVLVDETKVELTFYFQESGEIVTRNTTDGTVDMSGLPADEPFVVALEADGYHNRRRYVDSVFGNLRTYLLPTDVPSVAKTFKLSDFSSDFPSDVTVLKVQRALVDGTGDITWQTVEGDFFGDSGEVPTHLRYNTRHRLILLNTETGQIKDAGVITPVADGETTIRVLETGDVLIGEGESSFQIEPTTRRLPAVNGTTVRVRATDRTTAIDEWTVTITYRNETTTTELRNVTRQGEGLYSTDLDLRNRSGGNVTVAVDFELVDGTSGTTSAEFQVIEHFANEHSLLSILSGITSNQIPARNVGSFTTLVALFTSLFVATAVATNFRASTEAIGLVVVMVLAAFSIVDWFAYPYLFAVIIGWIAFAGIRRGV